MPENIIKNPWSKSVESILSSLDVPEDKGLSKKEVKERRKKYGYNKLKESKKKSGWEILIDQFTSLIVLVLIATVIVSFLFGQNIEGFAILAVVLVNGAIGFFTEFKAVKSMESLKELTKVKANVKRNGNVKQITADKIVPGDIVLLEGGDIVSADRYKINRIE